MRCSLGRSAVSQLSGAKKKLVSSIQPRRYRIPPSRKLETTTEKRQLEILRLGTFHWTPRFLPAGPVVFVASAVLCFAVLQMLRAGRERQDEKTRKKRRILDTLQLWRKGGV